MLQYAQIKQEAEDFNWDFSPQFSHWDGLKLLPVLGTKIRGKDF